MILKKLFIKYRVKPATKPGCWFIIVTDYNNRTFQRTHHKCDYKQANRSARKRKWEYQLFVWRVWLTGKNKHGVKCVL